MTMSDTFTEFWPTPKNTDGDRGGRGDLLAKARSYQMAHNGTAESASNQLTLFAEAFPASPTPWLVDAKDLPMSATSGPSSPELFAKFDPAGSWRKTYPDCCPVMLDGSLEPFLETWPRAGMTRNGTAYQRPPSAPLTKEIGSGSWRTPTAEEATHPGRTVTKPGQQYHLTVQVQERQMFPTPTTESYGTNQGGAAGRVGPIRPSLETMARQNLWPTPCAEDAKNVPYQKGKDGVTRYPMLLGAVEPSRMWPTSTGRDHKDGSAQACANVPPNGLLGRVVHQWPTPSSGGESGGPHGMCGGTAHRQRLVSLVGEDQARAMSGGALNPTWVEWLMGYPLGWTACAAWATRSSRRSPNGSRTGSRTPKGRHDARR
jgi:hypothetical protein